LGGVELPNSEQENRAYVGGLDDNDEESANALTDSQGNAQTINNDVVPPITAVHIVQNNTYI